MSAPLSLDQRILYTYVAMQSLAHGRALNDIAEEVGVSRFAASRMVKKAREIGLVEVRASTQEPVDVDLSQRLARRFGMRSAVVVSCASRREEDIRDAIAGVAAGFLQEHANDDDLIGLAPGRTMVALSRRVTQLPWMDVVQITGVGAPRLEDGVEAIVNIARASGGASYPLYTPIVVEQAEQALIVKHPSHQRTIRRFDHLTKVFLTIGGWPSSSLLAQQLADLGEMETLVAQGVVAEIGTVLLDDQGNSVHSLRNRIIGISEEQLRAVDMRVAVGGGPGKEGALGAILRSGIPNHVITDTRSAISALMGD
ncbi:sugar-binding transcriptional regulator [Microbacterium sp. zg.Y909]|uniref:sugar-binding transcriptional regulator n=1 Tax=Microbacterium sp. zg.Y909 TaxID=2969413 RepID=UPI00214AF28A|nr:sugar-binding domain-containing protein [Microbacterium sp. zg.Y909]MCR2825078.1 hypothetical protein [Microbacterium sp. zg.Y909]